MRVLAVDTTSARESVALVDGGAVAAEARLTVADSHSQRLLPAIDFVLRGAGIAPSELDGFAVATGPGSFTGVRVGLSTVAGLALASNRPCLGISALDALAARVKGASPWLVAMMDAYRDDVFAALYDREASLVGGRALVAPDVFLEGVPEDAAFVGDGALRYRQGILARRPRAVFPARSLFLAGTLGLLAEPRLLAGEGVPAAQLRPLYLRESGIRAS